MFLIVLWVHIPAINAQVWFKTTYPINGSFYQRVAGATNQSMEFIIQTNQTSWGNKTFSLVKWRGIPYLGVNNNKIREFG